MQPFEHFSILLAPHFAKGLVGAPHKSLSLESLDARCVLAHGELIYLLAVRIDSNTYQVQHLCPLSWLNNIAPNDIDR
jgi:hypothetical protein